MHCIEITEYKKVKNKGSRERMFCRILNLNCKAEKIIPQLVGRELKRIRNHLQRIYKGRKCWNRHLCHLLLLLL